MEEIREETIFCHKASEISSFFIPMEEVERVLMYLITVIGKVNHFGEDWHQKNTAGLTTQKFT